MKALVWFGRSGVMECDTAEEAVSYAFYVADEDWVDAIEVVHDDGRAEVLSSERIAELETPLIEEATRTLEARSVSVGAVEVRAPQGAWKPVLWIYNSTPAEETDAAATKWRALLGADRVAVRVLGERR